MTEPDTPVDPAADQARRQKLMDEAIAELRASGRFPRPTLTEVTHAPPTETTVEEGTDYDG
jgi:hypothetical protein